MSYYCMYCGKILTTGDKVDSCYDCPKRKITISPSDIEYYMQECAKLKAENERLLM